MTKKKKIEPNELIIGCNYRTKWQAKKGMRFVLCEIKDGRARLCTRTTRKCFWTDIADLEFIPSPHNIEKALETKRGEKVFNERQLNTVSHAHLQNINARQFERVE